MDKGYENGRQDALALFGKICSSQGSCEDCAVTNICGDGMTCQEFMAKFPAKMISLLTDMDSKEYTYYNEFMTRFPYCRLTLKELSECLCRRVAFEGYPYCGDKELCIGCWSERYVEDAPDNGEE